MTLGKLPSLAAVGAVVLAVLAGPAAAHSFTVKNCTGNFQSFSAYDEGDSVTFSAASWKNLENGESDTLRCNTKNHCQARINNEDPVRVTDAITYYTTTRYVRSVDETCAGKTQ